MDSMKIKPASPAKAPRPDWVLGLQNWWDSSYISIISVVLFFLVWEGWVRLFHVEMYILPPPSAVFVQLVKKWGIIWDYTLVTGYETLVGFALSVVIGIPLAMMVAFSKFLRQTVYPVCIVLEMIPKIAFAPLFIIWFGFGTLPKMFIVFLVCFFPILLNGILGFTSLSSELGYFTRSTGANAITTFWKIRLPAAMPELFVGLKGAATNATVGAVVAEWVGGDAGLGYYIQIASGDMRMDIAFAVILMLAVVGLALFYVVAAVETKMIPWHVSQRAPIQGPTGL
jgi:NitT/TauT family transport system permease protein